jgi:DNA-binding MarR family transcriptional regulator
MSNLHRVLSDPDRIRVMDYLATAGEPVSGRQITQAMGLSDLWVSRSLVQMAQVGLISREPDTAKDAFNASIRNRLAPDIVWPIGMSAAAHYALTNPDRVRIMDYLAGTGRAIVGKIAGDLGIGQTTMSKHLIIMDRAGLIARQRDGGMVWNSIAPGVVWPVVVRRVAA